MQVNKNDRTIKLVDLTSVKYNILAACKIKIENASNSTGKKTDMLIGFGMVGLAVKPPRLLNLSSFW